MQTPPTPAVALSAALMVPAMGKDYAVSKKNPAIVLTIPDSWKVESIDYGFKAASAGDDVYFYLESTPAKGVDKMMALNDEWMKEQGIKPDGDPKVTEVNNPVKAKIFNFKAHDKDGPTNVSFTLIPSKDGVIMLTLWGSDEEQRKHNAEIDKIFGSIRAAN